MYQNASKKHGVYFHIFLNAGRVRQTLYVFLKHSKDFSLGISDLNTFNISRKE